MISRSIISRSHTWWSSGWGARCTGETVRRGRTVDSSGSRAGVIVPGGVRRRTLTRLPTSCGAFAANPTVMETAVHRDG